MSDQLPAELREFLARHIDSIVQLTTFALILPAIINKNRSSGI